MTSKILATIIIVALLIVTVTIQAFVEHAFKANDHDDGFMNLIARWISRLITIILVVTGACLIFAFWN